MHPATMPWLLTSCVHPPAYLSAVRHKHSPPRCRRVTKGTRQGMAWRSSDAAALQCLRNPRVLIERLGLRLGCNSSLHDMSTVSQGADVALPAARLRARQLAAAACPRRISVGGLELSCAAQCSLSSHKSKFDPEGGGKAGRGGPNNAAARCWRSHAGGGPSARLPPPGSTVCGLPPSPGR